jgi:branched-chain amino acid transport system ATP-binding protein
MLLELKHINAGYDKKQVLFDISFGVSQGQVVLLIGSNGAGKSTILKTVYGLIRPMRTHAEDGEGETSSQIFFNGKNIIDCPSFSLLSLGLMYVPQKDYCFDTLTVRENMNVSGRALKDSSLFRERYDQVLDFLPGLRQILNSLVMKLSGGERQLLALGMALVHKPKLLMLDEPLAGLSPKSIEQVSGTLTTLNRTWGTTLLIVEQNLRDGLKIASHVIGLKLGRFTKTFAATEGIESEMLRDIFF